MVDVWLPFGKTEICLTIPARNFLGLIEPKEKVGVQDPIVEVKRALNEPIGAKKIHEIADPGSKVAIVVDDATRPTPSHLMVPPIIEELKLAGVKDENITIIFGCGTHRPVTEEEALKILGENVVKRFKVISHNCRAPDLIYIGTTPRHGTKVYINKVFADADIKILTGDICLHYYAGYGGGRKSILPGIAGEETIRANHAMLLHPNAKTGVLEGNPVHEDMMDAAKMANVDFILNVVINSKGEIVKAFAGDLEKAFYEGVKLVDEMYKVQVDQRADIVVVSPGGYPSDLDLFQAYKAVDSALNVVKRGGVIVLIAECSEGYGNQVFYEWMVKFKDLRIIEKQIKQNFVLGGHKAYYLLKALQKAQIILVSVMPDYYAVNVFKLKTARTANEALSQAFTITGEKAKVWAIPYGNYTLPEVKVTED